MSDREDLIDKLTRKPYPKSFTVRELDRLMSQCHCSKFNGGRGSSIGYRHALTGLRVQFDGPHPGKELYKYQIKEIISFLEDTGEIERR